MKKMLAAVLLGAMLFVFGGCGETAVDAGNISAVCPGGWFSFKVISVFSSELGEDDMPDKNALEFVKGTGEADKTDIIMGKYAYVRIDYNESSWYDISYLFDDVHEASLTVDGKEWKGFTGKSVSTEYTFLYNEDRTVQVKFFTNGIKSRFSVNDSDVKQILKSVSCKSKEE